MRTSQNVPTSLVEWGCWSSICSTHQHINNSVNWNSALKNFDLSFHASPWGSLGNTNEVGDCDLQPNPRAQRERMSTPLSDFVDWIEQSTEVWYDSSVLWTSPLFLMSTHFFYLLPKTYPYPPQHTHTHTPTTTPEALWGSNDTVICYKNLTSSRSKVTWLHLPRSLRCCGVAWRVLPLKRSPSSPTAMIASILSWDEIKVLGARDINLL